MSRLTLLLLGPPRIEVDGEPIKVDTRKAVALLAYLAVTRTTHTRDALAMLLWPDHDQVDARGALRRTLSVLNKALDGTWLDVDRETLALQHKAGLRIDVEDFHDRLARAHAHRHAQFGLCAECMDVLTQAVGLYRDDFMAGFTLRDSPDFDDWQFSQAERMRMELSSVLEQLVSIKIARREWGPATEHGRRWLALDPMHEPAQRQLMLAYAWAGQRAAALRQYRECVRVLQQELGVPPLPETTALYERIKEYAAPPPPEALPGHAAVNEVRVLVDPPHGTALRPQLLPLVGRAQQWEVMREAYNDIHTDGALLVLEGEAGIGKTRLAEEFLSHARTEGASTLSVRCFEGETGLSYGPLTPALREAVKRMNIAGQLESVPAHLLAEVARLLPELSVLRSGLPAPPPLDSPGAQSRFFEGITRTLLSAVRADRPGVLCFEDLHWADTSSLDLLMYLVRRLQGQRVCVLATWRAENVPAGHRLRTLLAEHGRVGTMRTLSLPRLTRATVLELADSMPALASDVADRVYTETEGLPFFLSEYLAVLTRNAEDSPQASWTLPGGVRDLLHSRLSTVSGTGWQLLNTAAVIGRSFEFDTLRGASGRSEEETVAGLEALVSSGLVREVSNGGGRIAYLFGHEKLREVVYEETSLARRRLLHRRVAETLVSRTRGQIDAQREVAGHVAEHFRLAGQDAEAAVYHKLAGDRSRALYANAEALSHFSSALALGDSDVVELHEAIGDMHTLLGEYGRALESYETAAALSGIETLPRLERKLGDVYHRRGELETAERHFEAALEALPADNTAGERAGLHADWSLVAHQRGDTPRAVELARFARELAEAAADVRSLAQTHNLLGILASSQGDHRPARHYLEHSLALAETIGDPGARVAALNNLSLACRAGGNIQRALELGKEALALCGTQGDRHHEAALHNNLADMLHSVGQREAAMAHLKEAVAIYAEIGVEAGAVQPGVWKLTVW